MPSVMGVQRIATLRNQRAEQVSTYIFDRSLCSGQATTVHTQASFESPIAHDVWDNKVTLPVASSIFEIWSQTTCYKGHATARPEPNKTYEMRETMSEALSLLASQPSSAPGQIRTVHLTFGSATYAYPWFEIMKRVTFDVSLYLELPEGDIHEAIAAAIGNLRIESAIFKKLDEESAAGTPLGISLTDAVRSLNLWYEKGLPTSKYGRLQADAVRDGLLNIASATRFPQAARSTKQIVIDAMFTPDGTAGEDPIVREVITEFLKQKPFLMGARSFVSDWSRFDRALSTYSADSPTVESFIQKGWSAPDQMFRECFRRVLLRTGHMVDVEYVQDINVPGLTEHNLYGPQHSPNQLAEISTQVSGRLAAGSITTPARLKAEMSLNGEAILKSLISFEVQNGTRAGFSSRYAKKAIQAAGYKVCRPSQVGLDLVGYHSEIVTSIAGSSTRIDPYQNFDAIISPSGTTLCLLKTKHFRNAEFDRRAKEEAFVGLTLTHELKNNHFRPRLEIPVIMCVDTSGDAGSVRAQRSLRKLAAFGWIVVVGLDHLILKLGNLNAAD